MRSTILCDPYFYENPSVLFRTGLFHTSNTTCVSEVINHLVLLTIVFALFSAAVVTYFKMLIPAFLAFLLGIYLAFPSLLALVKARRTYEAFQEADKVPAKPSVDVIGSKGCGIASAPLGGRNTLPAARNPFMNVLIDEIKYNPSRPPAASVLDPSIQIPLDDFFRTEFARDPTDVFGRNQSQREFYTMPSTSIPNDVDSFQKWLYKIPGKTCKEGGREACLPGTDGGPFPWLNKDS